MMYAAAKKEMRQLMWGQPRLPERIADIHCHILPGLDDGSSDMEETLKMLRIAQEQGVTHIIATPHYKAERHNASVQTIQKRLDEVRKAAAKEQLSIRLYLGNEILFFGDMEEMLDRGRIMTMNDTRYVLVEFMPGDEYTYIRNGLDSVIGMGYSPILAHIERYACVMQQITYAEELHDMGVEIQINAVSVTGRTGRKSRDFVRDILKRRLVDYVATDSHDSRNRTPAIQDCANYICKKYDAAYAEAILYRNAWDRLLKEDRNAGE